MQDRNCGITVAPHNLVEAADPEQRLALAAHVTELAIQLRRALEERQLARVLAEPLRVRPSLRKVLRMNHAATSQRKIGFHSVQVPLGESQHALVAAEDGAFIAQPGLLDSILGAHGSPPPGPAISRR
jgi:hypothetical protein